MSSPQRVDRRVGAAIAAVLLAVAPAACKQADAVEQEHYQASKVVPSEHGDHPTVILTELAAKQAGLRTVPIEKSRDETAIPYSALLYDADGQPYVFANPRGLEFHREDVEVAGVDGDVVRLSDGPAVGTRVVSDGVPLVHGAELEFGAY